MQKKFTYWYIDGDYVVTDASGVEYDLHLPTMRANRATQGARADLPKSTSPLEEGKLKHAQKERIRAANRATEALPIRGCFTLLRRQVLD